MAARKGRQATRGGGSRTPAWVWMLVGMVAGAALMALVLVKGWAPLLRSREMPQPNPQATAPKPVDAPVPESRPKKNYDFYQVLPEAEVEIPDAELTAKARAEQQAATSPTTASPAATGGARYVLQAGSYPDPRGADEVKARLALSGFTAYVQPVVVNGRTWHRVRVGPYGTASELEAAKRTLAESGIKAIALKETGP